MTTRALLRTDPAEVVETIGRAQLGAEAMAYIAGCRTATAAAARLLDQKFVAEAARVMAHALPRREAVRWACDCAVHRAYGVVRSGSSHPGAGRALDPARHRYGGASGDGDG